MSAISWLSLGSAFPALCRYHCIKLVGSVDLKNFILASCPWGPATAPLMGLLTEMYVILPRAFATLEGLWSVGWQYCHRSVLAKYAGHMQNPDILDPFC